MSNQINITVSGSPESGFTASSDNSNAGVNKNKHVVMRIGTVGWEFNQDSSAAPEGNQYADYTSPYLPNTTDASNCGIFVDDPNHNFTCIEKESQYVKLKDSSDDTKTMPKHGYCALLKMTDGDQNYYCQLDPYVRDKGVNQ